MALLGELERTPESVEGYTEDEQNGGIHQLEDSSSDFVGTNDLDMSQYVDILAACIDQDDSGFEESNDIPSITSEFSGQNQELGAPMGEYNYNPAIIAGESSANDYLRSSYLQVEDTQAGCESLEGGYDTQGEPTPATVNLNISISTATTDFESTVRSLDSTDTEPSEEFLTEQELEALLNAEDWDCEIPENPETVTGARPQGEEEQGVDTNDVDVSRSLFSDLFGSDISDTPDDEEGSLANTRKGNATSHGGVPQWLELPRNTTTQSGEVPPITLPTTTATTTDSTDTALQSPASSDRATLESAGSPAETATSPSSLEGSGETTGRRIYRVRIGRYPKPRAPRKRKRKEVEEPEVIELLPPPPPKKQAVPRAPPTPLMPKDKVCLIHPAPEGFDWRSIRPESYRSPWWLSRHLPVDSEEHAQEIVDHIEHFWLDEGSAGRSLKLRNLPFRDDPAKATEGLIRLAEPYFDIVKVHFPGYYQKLMDPGKKELYGYIYFRCIQGYRDALVEQEEVRERQRVSEQHPGPDGLPAESEQPSKKRKRKAGDEADLGRNPASGDSLSTDGGQSLDAEGTSKRQKVYGNDGKLIHQRGRKFKSPPEPAEVTAEKERLWRQLYGA
ncbi:hypothetical protein ABW19_dt0208826 [Dactylella cylindrospora]|nr:hypothetical protein ABW19_dt0208826 [Dactylella cylindrospora]